MFAGVAGLATGTAAVLANAQPLLIRLPAWWLCGAAVSTRTAGALLAPLAATASTGGTLLARRLSGLDVIVASGWHPVIDSACLALTAAVVEAAPVITGTPRFVAVLAFLSLAGGAAAVVALVHRGTAVTSGHPQRAWTFLTPVFGIVRAALLLGERPSGWTAAGQGAVLIVMAAIHRPHAPSRAMTRRTPAYRGCRRQG